MLDPLIALRQRGAEHKKIHLFSSFTGGKKITIKQKARILKEYKKGVSMTNIAKKEHMLYNQVKNLLKNYRAFHDTPRSNTKIY